jgi:hypothetical protein
VGGGLLLAGALFFMLRGGKSEPGKSGSSTTASTSSTPGAPVSMDPPPRAANFLQPGILLHFRAGERMDAYTDLGKPTVTAKPGDKVLAWHDLASNGGDGALMAINRLQQNCPTYVQETPSALKFKTPMLRFTGTNAMLHSMGKDNPAIRDYPLGGTQKDPGLTVVMLVRPNITNKEVRCLRVRNSEDKGHLSVRAYPNNEWKLGMKIGNTVKEQKVTGRNVKQFNLIGVSWNEKTSKMLLSVRSEDGGKGRAEGDAPKEKAEVFNEIRIADYDATTPVAAEDLFSGDVLELMVWPYAMGWEDRSGQEFRIVQEYFVKPGQRY